MIGTEVILIRLRIGTAEVNGTQQIDIVIGPRHHWNSSGIVRRNSLLWKS
jgi:hypothetical protein